ncbi:hypothetical protein MUP37_07650 [Candidatus Bathyarchaeota archaeon]|nr:hypothetical protein [Candidatus Bathyarchaeota archaeon]
MKFLVVHQMLPTPLSLEAGVPLMKRIAANMTAECYWVATWCQANAEGQAVKIMCRYDSTSIEAVREAVAKLAPELPVEAIYPLMIFDSGDFR